MSGGLKMTLVLLAVLALTVMGSALSLGALKGENQTTQNQNLIEQQQKRQEELESQFPVIDYDAAEDTNPAGLAKRRAKNGRYDKRNLVSKDSTPRISESALLLEGYYVPALPTAKSNLIVVGEVLASAAHLSNDKGDIYTELTVRVGEVIKNSTSIQLAQGAEITAEREGGIVRYANGHKRLHRMAHEGMPTVGRRYVLFLSSIENSDDYTILTGYELTQTGVVPVDFSRHFAAYQGYAVDAFLDLIRAPLNGPQ